MDIWSLLGDGTKISAATAMAATTEDPPISNDSDDYPDEVVVRAQRATEERTVSVDM